MYGDEAGPDCPDGTWARAASGAGSAEIAGLARMPSLPRRTGVSYLCSSVASPVSSRCRRGTGCCSAWLGSTARRSGRGNGARARRYRTSTGRPGCRHARRRCPACQRCSYAWPAMPSGAVSHGPALGLPDLGRVGHVRDDRLTASTGRHGGALVVTSTAFARSAACRSASTAARCCAGRRSPRALPDASATSQRGRPRGVLRRRHDPQRARRRRPQVFPAAP